MPRQVKWPGALFSASPPLQLPGVFLFQAEGFNRSKPVAA